MKKGLKYAFYRKTVITALKVAMVVGLILNFINQGDIIINLQWEKLDLMKFFMTFAVPYLVSTYSSAKTMVSLEVADS